MRTARRTLARLAFCLLALSMAAASVLAQRSGQPLPRGYGDAGLDEQLGETVPTDVTLYDEEGEEVTLASYLQGGRPVILNFVYYDCPMLCNILLDGFTGALEGMEWTPGGEFEVVTVSFATGETPEMAARAKRSYLKKLGRPEAADGWHFLTGDEAEVERLTQAAGFSFAWNEDLQQYAHPAALVFLGPEAKITRYLYGLTFPPGDVRKALVEASDGTVGTTVDRLLLYCLQYDPNANSYVLHAQNAMRLAGLVTVLVLGAGLLLLWRRERHRTGEPAFTETA